MSAGQSSPPSQKPISASQLPAPRTALPSFPHSGEGSALAREECPPPSHVPHQQYGQPFSAKHSAIAAFCHRDFISRGFSIGYAIVLRVLLYLDSTSSSVYHLRLSWRLNISEEQRFTSIPFPQIFIAGNDRANFHPSR
ncbi:hypothetical protein Nepgr_021161 [Nepenthes gracilis]|uniref:Uncharacterized protein n=1 Tax=Nepenthes gracilis TaxID=150966 RepID=A0AAD3XWZ3_NEPGR|nr:hypothetical protein Nepgr_021161 [Nepenthes gracilis]